MRGWKQSEVSGWAERAGHAMLVQDGAGSPRQRRTLFESIYWSNLSISRVRTPEPMPRERLPCLLTVGEFGRSVAIWQSRSGRAPSKLPSRRGVGLGRDSGQRTERRPASSVSTGAGPPRSGPRHLDRKRQPVRRAPPEPDRRPFPAELVRRDLQGQRHQASADQAEPSVEFRGSGNGPAGSLAEGRPGRADEPQDHGAVVKRYPYDIHPRLPTRFAGFLAA